MILGSKISQLPPIEEALLTWQDPEGRRRQIVGVARLEPEGGASFRYLKDQDLDAARSCGFEGYPAFPKFQKTYRQGVLQSFTSRLTSAARRDYHKYLEYWFVDSGAEPTPFQLLAHTGGVLPRDGFRFVPVLPTSGTVDFITELAGARYHLNNLCPKGATQRVDVGQALVFKAEPENPRDADAVEVIRREDTIRVGYLMRGLAHQVRTWDARIEGTIARINGAHDRPVILARVRADFGDVTKK